MRSWDQMKPRTVYEKAVQDFTKTVRQRARLDQRFRQASFAEFKMLMAFDDEAGHSLTRRSQRPLFWAITIGCPKNRTHCLSSLGRIIQTEAKPVGTDISASRAVGVWACSNS
jgi:hypothetical protein